MREKILSSIQYATGWVLLVTFGYAFILPLFGLALPFLSFVFSVLYLAFLTHAMLGARSTTRRYRLWRNWLDGFFLAVWLSAVGALLYFYIFRV